MATGQPSVDNPSLRLSSQVILGCVKLTVKAVLLLGKVVFQESLLASQSLLIHSNIIPVFIEVPYLSPNLPPPFFLIRTVLGSTVMSSL